MSCNVPNGRTEQQPLLEETRRDFVRRRAAEGRGKGKRE